MCSVHHTHIIIHSYTRRQHRFPAAVRRKLYTSSHRGVLVQPTTEQPRKILTQKPTPQKPHIWSCWALVFRSRIHLFGVHHCIYVCAFMSQWDGRDAHRKQYCRLGPVGEFKCVVRKSLDVYFFLSGWLLSCKLIL